MFHFLPPNSIKEINPGAFQLLQLQEDIRRQFKMDGSGPENDVESHIRLNKDTLMNSLWKLNVVDIEITLIHVCQLVSGFYSVSSFPLLKECMDAAGDSHHGLHAFSGAAGK